NVAEAFAADLGKGDFHAAFVANDAAVLHAFVLAAQALPVHRGAKDAGAEQAVPLRLEGAVVDGLGFGHFAVRPAPDLLRRGQANANGIKIGDRTCQVKGARTKHVPPLPALRGSSQYLVPSTELPLNFPQSLRAISAAEHFF